ncbi:hypothetical protein PILCRDRAFT_826333 [Piloderma croceum F 1598]|uniref:DUF6534 domain-containing protein n=1 Tax=Piloderma croceum (strain F 1598) TaxID=765440 RepID=A0A0C3F8T2_PILCF|nr:hypothetical protein PILCRDRAFT_826333 [Piloderma croceum F 1598]
MSEPFKLDNTMGVTLIGVIFAAALWGVSCVQVWFYFNNYPKDAWYIKLLVAAVLASDTTHQALISHTIYSYLITNFGNVVELGNIVWSLQVQVIFNALTAVMVQSFLTFRVWRLSNGSYILTSLVVPLVVGEFVTILYYFVKGSQLQTYAQLAALRSLSMAVNALAAAGDVLIAFVLCLMLQKSRTGFRRSDTMIKKLIIFTMNTGLLTSICAVASLISIVSAPNTIIYIAFYFNLGRLYSNTLVATLNARQSIRSVGDEVMTVSLNAIQNASSTAHSKRAANIAIKVDTQREYTRDDRPDELFVEDGKGNLGKTYLQRQS